MNHHPFYYPDRVSSCQRIDTSHIKKGAVLQGQFGQLIVTRVNHRTGCARTRIYQNGVRGISLDTYRIRRLATDYKLISPAQPSVLAWFWRLSGYFLAGAVISLVCLAVCGWDKVRKGWGKGE